MNVDRDWTVDSEGRSNNSEDFHFAVGVVERLLNNHRCGDQTRRTARLIVAKLAHTYGFAPSQALSEAWASPPAPPPSEHDRWT
jgi:hypothetical protein